MRGPASHNCFFTSLNTPLSSPSCVGRGTFMCLSSSLIIFLYVFFCVCEREI
ncbi:hypothetical protein HanXRQr2_Chr05g0212171 [Helianthus annuus]|uniref:Uncharacterized protein n=1 Tax=Helianthus annuus TaxID=4232 RepID=A0A9K3NMW0_HELAN|nr:hypothetical protein HanXRQr2_Chr05g0212171 [Helianthus annuus]